MVATSSFPASDSDSRNAGVFVVDLARMLNEAGCDVTVISPQRTTVSGPFDTLSFPRLGSEPSLSHLNPRTPGGALKLASVLLGGIVQMPRQARLRRIDHILALWAVPSGLLALVSKFVFCKHYSVWTLGSDIWRIRDYPGGRKLLRLVLRQADHVYADGMGLAEDTSAISGSRTDFLATSRVLLPASRKLWADQFRHVVTIARFHEHKGVDVLIDAVASMPPELRSGIRVHIFGDGPMRGQLERSVNENSLGQIVHFEGFADGQQAADALRSADLAVVPSRVESIPLILSDICNADAPMVVTDAGDMGTLVSKFGAGLVAVAGDSGSLRNQMVSALTSDLDVATKARSDLAEHLSLRRSVIRFLDDLSIGAARTE
ncbi:MAG: glycosyltransferase [Microthrixaceae bacterium]